LWAARSGGIRHFLAGGSLADVVEGRLAERRAPLDAAAE